MTTYVPAEYWRERGRTYEREARRRGWWGAENEPLFRVLDTIKPFSSVLEVGCGFGRVGAAILRRWPDVQYTGIDVSPDLVAGAKRQLPDSAEVVCDDLATWDPARQWDLVVSVSVLGHILPADIGGVIGKMMRWARNDIVAIDWDDIGASTAYQFGHDYRVLYGDRLVGYWPYGRQSVFHVKPPKDVQAWEDAFG